MKSVSKGKVKSNLTFQQVLEIVKAFSFDEKLALERELEKLTLIERARRLSKSVKKNNITDQEIVDEIKAYRKEKMHA